MEQDSTPQRTPWYGWVIVVLAAAAMVATMPGRTFGLGIITERMLDDSSLNLTREQFADINFWATLIGALFCVPVGSMLDRCGLRLTLTFVVVLFGLSVVGMTLATTSLQFVLLISLTRGFGQSALSVVSISMTGKWFTKAGLPLATGVYSVLVSAAFMGAMVWASTQKEEPWRNVWATLGYALLFFFAPVFLLLVRSPLQERGSESSIEPDEDDFTLVEAMKTPAFWMFGIATSFYALVSSGTSLFNQSLLGEQGFDANAFYLLTIISIPMGLVSNLTTGFLSNYLRVSHLASFAMVLLASALFWLPHTTTLLQLIAYAVAMGFTGGMITVLFFMIWAKLFGRAELGKIQGVAQMLTVFASALGPVVFAKVQSRFGSYIPAVDSLGLIAAILAVTVAFVPIPKKKPATASDLIAVEPAADL